MQIIAHRLYIRYAYQWWIHYVKHGLFVSTEANSNSIHLYCVLVESHTLTALVNTAAARYIYMYSRHMYSNELGHWLPQKQSGVMQQHNPRFQYPHHHTLKVVTEGMQELLLSI